MALGGSSSCGCSSTCIRSYQLTSTTYLFLLSVMPKMKTQRQKVANLMEKQHPPLSLIWTSAICSNSSSRASITLYGFLIGKMQNWFSLANSAMRQAVMIKFRQSFSMPLLNLALCQPNFIMGDPCNRLMNSIIRTWLPDNWGVDNCPQSSSFLR